MGSCGLYRWNGVSSVDFPGILKVDPRNVTAIEETIQFALENYEIILGLNFTAMKEAKNWDDLLMENPIDQKLLDVRRGTSTFYAYILVTYKI